MYGRFKELISQQDRDAYLDQLRSIEVAREDPSHTTFSTLTGLTPIDIEPFQSYLDGCYEDLDGKTVYMIVHFVPPGIISWVERFRLDHKPVQNVWPSDVVPQKCTDRR